MSYAGSVSTGLYAERCAKSRSTILMPVNVGSLCVNLEGRTAPSSRDWMNNA